MQTQDKFLTTKHINKNASTAYNWSKIEEILHLKKTSPTFSIVT